MVKKMLLPCFLLSAFSLSAQMPRIDCIPSDAKVFLHGNNVRAMIRNNGSLFHQTDSRGNTQPGFQVPFRGVNSPHTVLAAGLWMGAKDTAGKLRMAVATYDNQNYLDFWSGPLNANGLTNGETCTLWNKIWSVTGEEILHHIRDWRDNGRIDKPLPNIMAWAGAGNPFFQQYNGFPLPTSLDGFAPFFDRNDDGIYNPLQGDYPKVESVNPLATPSQITWSVFNDKGNVHTNSFPASPLSVEVQLTTWAFDCADTAQVLANTIFASYKIIYRGRQNLDSCAIGFWSDMDIDCYLENYAGCDTTNHSFYTYMRKFQGIQSCPFPTTLYGANPPAQAITFLNCPLSYFGLPQIPNICSPSAPVNSTVAGSELFNYLTGRWGDGTAFTYGGNGYNSSSRLVKHLFPDDPTNPNGWSMASAQLICSDIRTLGSTYLGRIQPNQVIKMDIAFSFHRDRNRDGWQNVSLLRNTDVPLIRQVYADSFRTICTPVAACSLADDCVWAGDANRDSIVSSHDLLPIGWALGQKGTKREGSLRWVGQQSAAWAQSFPDGLNMKHVDCDGDSTITLSDFEISKINYGLTRPEYRPNELYTEGGDLVIESNANLDSLVYPFHNTQFLVKLQTDRADLYGIAFDLVFDPRYFVMNTNSTTAQSQSVNYLEKPVQNLPMRQMGFAKIRTDRSQRLEPQTLFRFNIANPSLDSARRWTTGTTFLRFRNIRGILKNGDYITLGSRTRRVHFADFGPLSNRDLSGKIGLRLAPNPAQTLLTIESVDSKPIREVQIYNALGQQVLVKKGNEVSQLVLDISALPRGMYILSVGILSERGGVQGGFVAQKLILN